MKRNACLAVLGFFSSSFSYSAFLFSALFFSTLIFTSMAAPAVSANTAATDNSRKLQELQREIIETQNNLQHADRGKTRFNKQLQSFELKLAASQRKKRLLKIEIVNLEDELKTLTQRRNQLKRSSKLQLQQLNNEVAVAYRLGQQEPIKLLLNIEDPQELNRTLKYYDYFVAARTRELGKYRSALAEIRTISSTINSKRDTLISERSSLEQEQQRLEEHRKQRQQLLAKFQQQYSSENARLKKLKNEENYLQSVIETIQLKARQATTGAPFGKQSGKLPWPVEGKLISAFGDQRASSLRWSGWLLQASEGSTVRTIHPGTVVFSDYLRGHGLLVIVDHGDGYLSLYAHNQTLVRNVGERVKGGDTIARVGSSGGIKRSALYFEIRHNGKAVNPKSWLRRRS
ncbi:MAG: peptidoglycan DD-metalloendopeptidase family protein [Porticoccaceae bacterium]